MSLRMMETAIDHTAGSSTDYQELLSEVPSTTIEQLFIVN